MSNKKQTRLALADVSSSEAQNAQNFYIKTDEEVMPIFNDSVLCPAAPMME